LLILILISTCQCRPSQITSSKQSSSTGIHILAFLLTKHSSSALDEVNRKARKSYNISGGPIKLPSKLLAVIPDPAHHDAVYVAESAATVKRVTLDDGKITHTYRGPDAPLSSLCLSADGTTLYAGCWDKLIWSWDVAAGTVISKMQGHTDFVKSVTFLATSTGQELLVSGGAEGDVLIWDAKVGQRLGALKGQSHAIQTLAFDPLQEDLRLFAAFSDPGIRHSSLSDLKSLRTLAFSPPILAHDTSVYRLCFDSEGDLWTASADKTAKHLVRADGWQSDTTLNHPDFVRDVAVHERYGWIITACRDEEVRIWSLSTGELYHTFSGHFEEVTGLCLVGDKVVTISIDATIRQWSLHPKDLQKAKLEAGNQEKAGEESTQKMDEKGKKAHDASALTEEEERELDELMENEERELKDLIADDEQ
jgi:WD40 repeat protein